MSDKKNGFLGEFKAFLSRGNVVDMAVGVIIGAAFKAIVDSLVADIIMPVVGIFVGAETFAALTINAGGAIITVGNFVQSILNFVIMAFVLFCFVKVINRMRKKEEAAPVAPPAPSAQEVLLTEIRDLLKEK